MPKLNETMRKVVCNDVSALTGEFDRSVARLVSAAKDKYDGGITHDNVRRIIGTYYECMRKVSELLVRVRLFDRADGDRQFSAEVFESSESYRATLLGEQVRQLLANRTLSDRALLVAQLKESFRLLPPEDVAEMADFFLGKNVSLMLAVLRADGTDVGQSYVRAFTDIQCAVRDYVTAQEDRDVSQYYLDFNAGKQAFLHAGDLTGLYQPVTEVERQRIDVINSLLKDRGFFEGLSPFSEGVSPFSVRELDIQRVMAFIRGLVPHEEQEPGSSRPLQRAEFAEHAALFQALSQEAEQRANRLDMAAAVLCFVAAILLMLAVLIAKVPAVAAAVVVLGVLSNPLIFLAASAVCVLAAVILKIVAITVSSVQLLQQEACALPPQHKAPGESMVADQRVKALVAELNFMAECEEKEQESGQVLHTIAEDAPSQPTTPQRSVTNKSVYKDPDQEAGRRSVLSDDDQEVVGELVDVSLSD